MRFVLGLLSLLSFAAVLLITLAFISNPPAQPLFFALALAVCFGLAVLFRVLRSRID